MATVRGIVPRKATSVVGIDFGGFCTLRIGPCCLASPQFNVNSLMRSLLAPMSEPERTAETLTVHAGPQMPGPCL